MNGKGDRFAVWCGVRWVGLAGVLVCAPFTWAQAWRADAGLGLQPTTVDAAQDITKAAVDSAVAQVVAQVSMLPMTPGLTVGGFLDATGGRGLLAEKISAAPRPGGVRQLGPETSQVRVDVSGEFLLAALAEVARERTGRSPIPAELIETQGAALLGRRFVATGTVTTPAAAMNVQRVQTGQAAAATPEQIEAARQRAIEMTVGRLRDAGVLPERSVEGAAASARAYLRTCPVRRIEVDAAGQVVVELSIVADELIAAINRQGEMSAEMRDAVQRAAVTSAPVKSETRGGESPGRMVAASPRWADDAFVATVRHKERLSRLALVRAAERKATAELRQQVVSRLSDEKMVTVGGGLVGAELLGAAADRAMSRVRTVSVDFVSADEVVVVVSLHGRQVWDELQKVAEVGR